MSLAQIALVGPGRINRSIAQAFLWAGHPVTVVDFKHRDQAGWARTEALVRSEVESGLAMLVRRERASEDDIPAMRGRLTVVGDDQADAMLAHSALIIEGAPEDLEVKRAVLGRIGKANDSAIIASATSTIMADELATFVDNPGRFLNAHFLNPAWLMPLVELSPAAVTDETVYEELRAMLLAIGKQPVRCAATPGFIVPRVQMAAGCEAIKLLEEGVANAADIDRALRIGFALRFAILGFLEFTDWGGLDIAKAAGDYLADRLGGEYYRAPAIVDAKLREGASGMYAGRGFYDYGELDLKAYRDGVTERLLDLVDYVGLFPQSGCAVRQDQ